ncbi:MAG: aldose epimerase family protein [Opitutales bacterium]
MSISSQEFGTLPDGQRASLFTLENKNGLRAAITNYGGIIVALHVPDRHGDLADVVLGKDDLQGYLDGHPYFGSITGRVAGRIRKGRFELDGELHQLPLNQPPSCLHGGDEGFDKMLWDAEIIDDGVKKLRLKYTDPEGHNHFPGTVDCTVTYALLDDNSLEIKYHATTDKATPFNLTNHSYFNLRGCGNGDVLGHSVQIFAETTAVVDEDSTLVGCREPVREDYNDFRKPVTLGELDTLEVGNADIHFFLEGGRTHLPKPAAVVREPESGRVMEVFTTEPGLQFYAGLFLDEEGPEPGKNGVLHKACDALCLETQDYPDSVNFPHMGGAILRPDEAFKSTTIYRFSSQGN